VNSVFRPVTDTIRYVNTRRFVEAEQRALLFSAVLDSVGYNRVATEFATMRHKLLLETAAQP
jgi:hypothetical protein